MLKQEDLQGLQELVAVGAMVKIWSNEKNERKLRVSLVGEKSLAVVYTADNLCALLKQASKRIKSTKNIESNMFPAVDWLLDKGLFITISACNNYYYLNIKAKDEYKYLPHGMFQTLTLQDNGIMDLLETTEGWASTLKNHMLEDVNDLCQE